MRALNKLGIFVAVAAISATAQAKDISISAKASYSNPALIQTNVKESCTALGDNFSKYTQAALQKAGWQVAAKEAIDAETQGVAIKLEITDAVSAGNWFIGHRKSTSILATLYKDGQPVDTYVANRYSSGGFFGGFKGSCSILNRTVKTLGSDVTKWISKKGI